MRLAALRSRLTRPGYTAARQTLSVGPLISLQQQHRCASASSSAFDGRVPSTPHRDIPRNTTSVAATAPVGNHRSAGGWSPRRATDEYAFPTHRALRYLRLGRHYFHRHDGRQQLLDRLLATASDDEDGVYIDDSFADNDDADTSALESLDRPKLEELRRFTNYHCHHVRVGFKADRAEWTRKTQRRGGGGDGQREGSSGHRQGGYQHQHQPLLSVADTNRVLARLFQASLLLHLTALFGASERYLEPLLDTCLSCSVFLSQQHNSWRHQQHRSGASSGGDGRRERSVRDVSRNAPRSPLGGGMITPSSLSSSPSDQKSHTATGSAAAAAADANSLHWAIVHYCEGVRLWGLADHSEIVFPALAKSLTRGGGGGPAGSAGLFAKLLQAHAGLLLGLNISAVSGDGGGSGGGAISSKSDGHSSSGLATERERRFYLRSLLGGAAAQQRSHALDAWFGLYPLPPRQASTNNVAASNSPSASFTPTPAQLHAQRRCLQLLPLLWLSMLTSHITVTSGGRGGSQGGVVDLRAARHALLRAIPLLACGDSEGAGAEPTFWALASVLYAPTATTTAASAGVGHVEVAAMLAAVERSSGSGGSDSQSVSADTTAVLLSWLRDWRRDNQRQQQLHLQGGSGGGGGSLGPRIHSARQLYTALNNIPLCCCRAFHQGLQQQQASMVGYSDGQGETDEDIVTRYFGGAKATAPHQASGTHRNDNNGSNKQRFQMQRTGGDLPLRSQPAAAAAAAAGLQFANELLFRILLQWRSAQLQRTTFTTQSISAAAAAAAASPEEEEEELAAGSRDGDGPASGPVPPPSRREIAAYSSYMVELAMVLEAAQHLRRLHDLVVVVRVTPASSSSDPATATATATATVAAAPVVGSGGEAPAFAYSVDAAMRALAEQLGACVFPARRPDGCATDFTATTTTTTAGSDVAPRVDPVERELLSVLHTTILSVLLGGSSGGGQGIETESETGLVGVVPESYLSGIQRLLWPAQP